MFTITYIQDTHYSTTSTDCFIWVPNHRPYNTIVTIF